MKKQSGRMKTGFANRTIMRVQFEIRNKRTTLYYNNYRTRKPVVDGKPTKVLCFGERTEDSNGGFSGNL